MGRSRGAEMLILRDASACRDVEEKKRENAEMAAEMEGGLCGFRRRRSQVDIGTSQFSQKTR